MPDSDQIRDEHTRLPADGSSIPTLGLGVWQVPNGPECEKAVRSALELDRQIVGLATRSVR